MADPDGSDGFDEDREPTEWIGDDEDESVADDAVDDPDSGDAGPGGDDASQGDDAPSDDAPDGDDAPDSGDTASEDTADDASDDTEGASDDTDDVPDDPADAPDDVDATGQPDVAGEEAAAAQAEAATSEETAAEAGERAAQAAGEAMSGAAGAFGGGMGEGPTAPDDEELPLTDHVEEMAMRLLAILLVVLGVGGVSLFYADEWINFLWYSFIGPGLEVCPGTECPRSARPRLYHPLALVLARLKIASLAGIIVALPVAVYQTYRFMRPGLYPRERRYYLAAVPTSLVLAFVGVLFAYLAVLPALFDYFGTYSERAAELAYGLAETFNLIVLMLGFFALVFQIPLLVMLAIMMGVTTRDWLAERRLYFWGGFAAVAFLFGPDPTGMAPLMMAVTMIVLFDGTLLLLRWTGEGSLTPTAEGMASRRPVAWIAAVLAGYLASPAPLPDPYYWDLPTVLRVTVLNQVGREFMPIVIAGGLILLFEIGSFLLRRFGHSRRALKLRLWVHKLRIPLWVLFVAVGYWGSPRPLLIRMANDLAIPLEYAVGLTLGLVVLYEVAIQAQRLREKRADRAVEEELAE